METSCGMVVINLGNILILEYPQGHWDFPKGHIEDDDASRIAAAIRELEEETGINDIVIINGFEERTEYQFRHKGKKVEKQVYWYIGETEMMEIQLSHEHRDHLWLDWEQAMEMLTHIESKEVLSAAQEHMKQIGRY
ncbi:MAG: NUDIX domain-containing protein [Candidatus Poseidoniaceae archaeon]|jgi:8-oxo-dGTP pyrophosphatase MutT (NUDIX family)|nr:NUDIX domain-containing protein [Candidatus Poseidoniaceae archaeon]MDP7202601.1 NUDIX domain-containing protein [Candidatus Poseidoniaceae archaeon]